MNPLTHSENHQSIVYDADRVPEADLRLLDPAFWENTNSVRGYATGRGAALLLDTDFGPAVLRRYYRGGWPAKFSPDRYLFTGVHNSRPFREFFIQRQLHESGLPVPAPLAAGCQRTGLSYRGALLMDRIMGVSPLGEILGRLNPDSPVWAAAGRCIRQFHEAGLNHSDLNANNLLVNEQDFSLYLVDFDRCRLNAGRPVDGRANLARLKRSLVKLWPANKTNLEPGWQALLGAYHA